MVAVGLTIVAGSGVPALAATGDLSYSGCISGETASTLAGSGPCVAVPSASPSGFGSGLNGASHVAVSPDGRNVYAISRRDDAISRFNRDEASGALSYRGCISGNLGLASSCAQIGDSTSGGEDSGLDSLAGIAISPNGRSVYVTAERDAALARFERNPATGILTYRECVTGEVAVSKQTICNAIPNATVNFGFLSGLAGPIGVVSSPDGRSVYVSARYDTAVAHFDAAAGTGALSYEGCISGRTMVSAACTLIPDATMSGNRSGLDGYSQSVGTYGQPEIAASPDGNNIYLTAQDDDAIARFNRNITTGALTYAGCLSGWLETPCASTETATSTGNGSGFGFPKSVAVSPDGGSVYVGLSAATVARFERGGSGALAWRGCISGSLEQRGVCDLIERATPFGDHTALDSVRSVTVSPDGANVYAAVGDIAAISRFNRISAGGAIGYADCFGADTRADCALIDAAVRGGADTGLSFPLSVDVSPDGENVYVSGALDSAVATFDRADASGPLLRLLDPRRQRSARRIAIEVSCDEPCRMVVRSIGRARGATTAKRVKLRLSKAKARLKTDETRKLKLRYKGKRSKRLVRKALRRGKRLTVRLQATATDVSGNKTTEKLRVKVKR